MIYTIKYENHYERNFNQINSFLKESYRKQNNRYSLEKTNKKIFKRRVFIIIRR